MAIDWKAFPSLTSLRAFEAAARLQSFTQAARLLNVTHAAIAQQVRALEAHLGRESVSYTHLDVYKRQTQSSSSS